MLIFFVIFYNFFPTSLLLVLPCCPAMLLSHPTLHQPSLVTCFTHSKHQKITQKHNVRSPVPSLCIKSLLLNREPSSQAGWILLQALSRPTFDRGSIVSSSRAPRRIRKSSSHWRVSHPFRQHQQIRLLKRHQIHSRLSKRRKTHDTQVQIRRQGKRGEVRVLWFCVVSWNLRRRRRCWERGEKFISINIKIYTSILSIQKTRLISPSPPPPMIPPRGIKYNSDSVPASPQHLQTRINYTPEPQRRYFRPLDQWDLWRMWSAARLYPTSGLT